MKVKTADRLKHLMKIRGLKQVDIINMSKPYQENLGISLQKSTLSQYINDIQSPDQDRIYLLAKTLNVGEAWLMGFDVDSYRVPDEERQIESIESKISKEVSKLTDKRKKNVLTYAKHQLEEQNNENNKVVPIITLKRHHATAAGVIGEELFDDLLEEDVDFREDEVPKGADFCVLVNGDSMEPMIKEGSYAFIKKTDTVTDGTIALVVLDGAGYIKRVDIYDDHLKLISLNPKYEDITVSSFNDLKVIGKVVL
ncbi:S24 family peptidase [Staphylococcus sp. IVB6227]|uniref:S24 family peptidase n=1 Tax=Staphylococcus sp. IVB6227 TaxID=2989768 RepID=UPI0021CE8A1B|nr:S24 family peptidase [Staphylococcus sp. IVB6227]UXR77671.1 helix-turn-helix domain-containing protein [Staphylococcus sp. IVB6227]